jgi:glycosyltransferase involved in cell wall biosynthesis
LDNNKEFPLVSVIVPTYNSAKYIEEALNSIFNQTFRDFEIIVVDDGSTDNTRQILEKYAQQIKYVCQANGGPSSARNTGIRLANGKYIAFLDADDLWFPEKLEKQIALFNHNSKLGMVTTGVWSFDEKGLFGYSANKRSKLMHGNIARNIFLHSNIGTPTVMVKKEVFDKIGVFEENIRQSEDDNMWIRIAANYDIELIDEALIKVRNHPSRMTFNRAELIENVQASIDLLRTKYGDRVKNSIESAIPIKTAYLQFTIGYGLYESGNYNAARKAFAKGASSWIWYWKNPLYLILTFIPKNFTKLLKSIKRMIAPAPTSGVSRKR